MACLLRPSLTFKYADYRLLELVFLKELDNFICHDFEYITKELKTKKQSSRIVQANAAND